jgi:hypothetical protein
MVQTYAEVVLSEQQAPTPASYTPRPRVFLGPMVVLSHTGTEQAAHSALRATSSIITSRATSSKTAARPALSRKVRCTGCPIHQAASRPQELCTTEHASKKNAVCAPARAAACQCGVCCHACCIRQAARRQLLKCKTKTHTQKPDMRHHPQ